MVTRADSDAVVVKNLAEIVRVDPIKGKAH
jgi:hypothetical protein